MTFTTKRVVGLVVCVALMTATMAAPTAAQANDEEAFLVELDAEGDADVTVTYTYDLDSEEEQASFEELRENTTAQEKFTERFENRLVAVAEGASDATDREMSVGDVRIEVERDGDVGVVTLTASWENLAAVDGDRLTVTEPFSSGFDPEMAFTVTAPNGFEIESATPEPTSSAETSATWEANADLEDFELVAEATANDDDAVTDGDAAGFGVLAPLVALLPATLLAVRWHSLNE